MSSSTQRKVRIAQIGVGYWGPNLLRNLTLNQNCTVAMVADSTPSRREYVEKNYPGVKTTPNADDIFADSTIDAVVIATPVATHFDLSLKALQSGKHILVEKPMASTPREVEQIGAAARSRGLVSMVGHTFIYSPAVRKLRELINSGELGQVRYLYSQRLNLGRIRSDVDALWNLAPHDVSIIQFLFGDPTPLSVKYSGMDYVQRGIDDVSFVNLVYPNKLMANIHVSWLDPHRTRRLTVVGTDKMAIYDDAAENKITIIDKGIDRMSVLGENMDYDHPAGVVFSHRSGSSTVAPVPPGEPLALEIAHFADCILNGTECLTGSEHALRVVKILDSCRRETTIHEIPTMNLEAPQIHTTQTNGVSPTTPTPQREAQGEAKL